MNLPQTQPPGPVSGQRRTILDRIRGALARPTSPHLHSRSGALATPSGSIRADPNSASRNPDSLRDFRAMLPP
ncbi:MAG: hypothetical protein NZ561_01935, partial [Phycisphaerae bacterium]|nr:hypothetical protein [Phycisphaerae bacterium]